MPKSSPIQSNFNTGEISKLLAGRVDFDKYKSALGLCLNGIPLIQGGVTRRPGTYYVASVKTPASTTRVIKFEFSTTQAYILEFGDLYFRVYMNHGQVTSGGSAVEVVTPYTAGEVTALKFVQSADVLYVAHPNHPPAKISRTSHTAWTITDITFTDGPYLAVNATSTTLQATTLIAAGVAGVSAVVASSTTGINSGAGFASGDVGRVLRMKTSNGNVWGWGTITAVTDSTHITVSFTTGLASTSTTTEWRLGRWYTGSGYPACVGFFQDRLVWAGSTGAPQSLQFSVVGDYENHEPSASSGTVADDNAIDITLNSGDVQVIRWVLPDEKGLLVGTVAGEWVVGPASSASAFSPTNVKADQTNAHGSADIQALRVGKAALFVQRAGRKLRELAYVYTTDGFNAPDLTVLSEHITLGGIVDMAYQQEPHSLMWFVRSDGVLVGTVYDREQNVIGWFRNTLGGYSDAAQTVAAKVESVAVIPAPDGTRDELWMVVQRYIDGAVRRSVEYMTKIWADGDTAEDAIFVDAALTYDSTAATTISGLAHLEGQTVTILADGATHPTKVVNAGAITLDRSASVVQVGLGYDSDGQTLRDNSGAADGTAQGKIQRKHRVTFRVLDSLGLKVGPNFTSMTRPTMRTTADDAGAAVPLFTGDILVNPWEGGYSKEDLVCWRWDQPLPGTMLAIMPNQHTQDG